MALLAHKGIYNEHQSSMVNIHNTPSLRKQPTREALLHLLRRCLNYVSDQPRERGPFAKYGVSHFASKIDYQMAEKLYEIGYASVTSLKILTSYH